MTPKRIENGRDFLFRIAQDAPGGNRRKGEWQARLAAGLWIKNELISIGWNQPKSHPLQKRFPRTPGYNHLHAEIHAIAGALKRMSSQELMSSRTTLMVVRAKKLDAKKNSPWLMAMAKPCSGCQEAIKHFQIDRVVWSDPGGDMEVINCNCGESFE